jgi:hypothetical protein
MLPNQSRKSPFQFPQNFRIPGTFAPEAHRMFGWAGLAAARVFNDHANRLGRLSFPNQRNAVKIKVQWSSPKVFVIGLTLPFQNFRQPFRLRSRSPRHISRISAPTGHWRRMKKWPTQNYSRQPAGPKNLAGAFLFNV